MHTATTTTAPTTSLRAPIELQVVRVLMVVLAFASIVGSFLFAWPAGGIDGVATGLVLDVVGVLFLVAAARLSSGERWVWSLGRWLAVAEVVWQGYKVFIYGEPESTGFLVAAVLITALIHLPRIRRFVAAGGAR